VKQLTPKQYEKLSPRLKLIVLAQALETLVEACNQNMLLKDTWVQDTFAGTAERLRELYLELLKEK
jgi:hypothetical protein